MLQPPARLRDDLPTIWRGPAVLFDPEDPKLRLKATSIVQHSRTERDRVLALYAFVKRIPFAKPAKLRLRTAREVLLRPRADAEDKATLVVAMLRAAGHAARLHYVELHGDVLRGLTDSLPSGARPVLQVWIDGRWRSTDTFIFDAPYISAARSQLRQQGWQWGYGLHVHGAQTWNGQRDAFLTGPLEQAEGISLGSMGVFHDPQDFADSPAFQERYPGMGRAVKWHVIAPQMNRNVSRLRNLPPPDSPPTQPGWEEPG